MHMNSSLKLTVRSFRGHVKTASQTYVELACEKTALFDKWCIANKVVNFLTICPTLECMRVLSKILASPVNVFIVMSQVTSLLFVRFTFTFYFFRWHYL